MFAKLNTLATLHHVRIALIATVVTAAAAQTANAQDLTVRFDGVEMTNHEELVFPDTPMGETRRFVITLRNEGAETLQFTENPPIMMSGGFPEHFQIIQPALEAGNTLSPNGSTAFAIDFAPNFRFQRLFTHVYIWTNADTSPFHIIFSGKATGSEMVVLVDGFEIPDGGLATFPETEVGSSTTVTVTIENRGDAEMTLTGDPLAQVFGGFDFDFSVNSQPNATIPGGDSASFEVTFAPTQERLYTTRMFINTDAHEGTNNGLYDIDIEANAVAAPVEDQPIDEDPIDEDPIDEDPIDENPGDEDPIDETPGDDDPEDGAPGDENPVDDQPIDDEPVDGNPTDDGSEQDQPEPGDTTDEQPGTDDGINDGGDEEPRDDEMTDEELQDLVEGNPLLPAGGLCGFGAGFAGLMGLISLSGAKVTRRRRIGSTNA